MLNTRQDTLVRARSRIERCRRPSSSSAGDTPVVVCGVSQYWNRKWEIWVCRDPGDGFLMKSLNVWTALSASLLVAGWKRALVEWQIPFCSKKLLNSELTNADALFCHGKIGSTQKWSPRTISGSQNWSPPDHFWQSVFATNGPTLPKVVLVGPNLAAKNGPA